MLLFEQNNEKTTRISIKATVISTTKVLSYKDIIKAQQKRNIKDVKTIIIKGRQILKHNRSMLLKIIRKRTRSYKREEAIDEIRASSIKEYCFMLKFKQFVIVITII